MGPRGSWEEEIHIRANEVNGDYPTHGVAIRMPKRGVEVIIYIFKKYFSITSNIILAVQQNYDRLV